MRASAPAGYEHIELDPVAGALGAEIFGADLSRPIDDATFAEIRRAFLEHNVIFFRGQSLTPKQFLAFARRWGGIHRHPYVQPIDGYPDILEILKTETDTRNFGGRWHTDQSFAPRPALGTLLYALETPSHGGDTAFANQYLAYDALSDGMKTMLDGLRAVFNGDQVHGQSRQQSYLAGGSMQARDTGGEQTVSLHPVVRTHPETGRKALYVGSHTQMFENMSEAESLPLLDYLRTHAVRPEFTCRFRWEPGALAFWDNRCTQHCALNDYPGQRRRMHRITIQGDIPN
jgi:taurine dioxygenase